MFKNHCETVQVFRIDKRGNLSDPSRLTVFVQKHSLRVNGNYSIQLKYTREIWLIFNKMEFIVSRIVIFMYLSIFLAIRTRHRQYLKNNNNNSYNNGRYFIFDF